MAGLFITFEGGEGAGKSTQIKLLADYFMSLHKMVRVTREPGGTPSAEAVRQLLVNGDTGRWSATSEALLNYAARGSHLTEVIRPALSEGHIVLCDRFMDSTRVYQGFAGGCDMNLIDMLESKVVGGTRPDLTFIFDLDPAIGLERARVRGAGVEDRYERKGKAFHDALRRGFLAVAKAEADRCIVINAAESADSVFSTLIGHVKARGYG